MKSKFLFPSYFKTLGVILAIPGFILGYFCGYHEYLIEGLSAKIRMGDDRDMEIENFTNETALSLVIVGLLFLAFSRQKREDELIAKLRLDALYWAVLINYFIYFTLEIGTLILSKAGYYKPNPLNFLGAADYALYNMFTPLLIFITRFHYLLHYKKETYLISQLHYLPYYPYRIVAKWVSVGCAAIIILLQFELPEQAFNKLSIIVTSPLLLPLVLLVWAYSKNANEDELTTQFRLESMQLAVYANYALLLIANFTIYGLDFLGVMSVNLISILLFFIIRFSYVCNKNYWQVRREVKGGLLS